MKRDYPSKIVVRKNSNNGFFGAPPAVENVEVNKIRIFVYDKSFNFSKYRIGLKYNESWRQWADDRGFELKHFKYDYFLTVGDSIADSQRLGPEVAPLRLVSPEPLRGYVETPVTLDPMQIQFLVAPPIELPELGYPDPDTEAKCFVVSDEGVRNLIVDPSTETWTQEDPPHEAR